MNRNPIRLLTATILLVFGLSFTFAQQAQNEASLSEIENTRQQWVDRYNQGDAAGVADLYAEDVQAVTETGETFEGPQELQEWLQGSLDAGATNVVIIPTDTRLFGDVAYDLGTYAYTTDDGQMVDQGHYLVILERTDGEWRITRQMVTSTQPQEGEGQAGSSG